MINVCILLHAAHIRAWPSYKEVVMYEESASSVTQGGLATTAANALNNVTNMDVLCKAETTDNVNPAICSQNLTFTYHQIYDPDNNFDAYQWSDSELETRRIIVPDFHSCDNAQTLCIPGPCAVMDANYLATWYIDEDDRTKSTMGPMSKFTAESRTQCAPLFGIQATVENNETPLPLDPLTVTADTMTVFPARSENPLVLHGYSDESPTNGFVPLPGLSTGNHNPKSYYTSTDFWQRPGKPDLVRNKDIKTCYDATLPPKAMPRQLAATVAVPIQGVTTDVHMLFNLDGSDVNFSDTSWFKNIAQNTYNASSWDHQSHCDLTVCAYLPIYNSFKNQQIDVDDPLPSLRNEQNPKGFSLDYLYRMMNLLANPNKVKDEYIGRYDESMYNDTTPNYGSSSDYYFTDKSPPSPLSFRTLYNTAPLWGCVPFEAAKNSWGISLLSSLGSAKKSKNANCPKKTNCNRQFFFDSCCVPDSKEEAKEAPIFEGQKFDMLVAVQLRRELVPDRPIQPQQWANGLTPLWHAAPTRASASFLNSKSVSMSSACDCGSVAIRYAVLEIPWNELAGTFYADQEWVDNVTQTQGTVLTEMSYGWARPIGDILTELPVGLYIPSTPKFDSNFVIHERNFLNATKSTTTVQELAEKTYINASVPYKEYLSANLVFDAKKHGTTPYAWHKHTFAYGACMRWPYGQVARMEMSEDMKNKYFQSCTSDGDCTIKKESLVGYCENFGTQGKQKYAHCARDPLTQDQRLDLCNKNRTQFVVVAKTLGMRSIDNVCNKTTKVCLIIPGEPSFSMNEVLAQSAYALDNFTLLITPFNWSVAVGLMAPSRGKYVVGGGTASKSITKVADNDTALAGMAALTDDQFAVFVRPGSVTDVREQVAGITRTINATFNEKDNTYDIPYMYDIHPVTEATVYAAVPDTATFVNAPYVTVASAVQSMPLRFASQPGTEGSCTRFFVSAPGFTTNVDVDQTNCQTSLAALERTPIVFGGGNVTSADVTVRATDCKIAVAFAGHYTSRFALTNAVNANHSTVTLEDTESLQYSIIAARTVGTIHLDSVNPPPVVVQPDVGGGINVTADNVTIINLTKYTSIFGNTVMQAEYPPLIPHESLHIVLFVALVVVNTMTALILSRRAYASVI